MLCILSPVLLIALSAAQEYGKIRMSEAAASGIGLVVLFVLIGIAVAIFVTSGQKLEKYEFLEKEEIDTAYGIRGAVTGKKDQFRGTYTLWITVGIVLCVLAVIPLFASMVFFGEDDYAVTLSMAVLLCIVAVGVYFIVRVSVVQGSFQMLLEEGDYSREEKRYKKKNGWIAGAYWLSVTAVFLICSYRTGSWNRSWIIWAVAGIAYAVLTQLVKSAGNRK